VLRPTGTAGSTSALTPSGELALAGPPSRAVTFGAGVAGGHPEPAGPAGPVSFRHRPPIRQDAG
jgi:hypothetical protein